MRTSTIAVASFKTAIEVTAGAVIANGPHNRNTKAALAFIFAL